MNIKEISNNTYLLINWFISYRFNWWFIHYRYQWLLPECSRHTLSYTRPVTSVELTADLSLFWIQISLSLLLHSVNIRYNVMHVPHNQNTKYALFSTSVLISHVPWIKNLVNGHTALIKPYYTSYCHYLLHVVYEGYSKIIKLKICSLQLHHILLCFVP